MSTTHILKALNRAFSPCLTLIQDQTGNWQPSCGAVADQLHALGVDFGPDGISTLALDDVLFNVSDAGFVLETIPLEQE